ncbi:MAG: hypothetical protein ACPGOY_03685 [Rhodospirillaceae bacterium]
MQKGQHGSFDSQPSSEDWIACLRLAGLTAGALIGVALLIAAL